MVKKRVQGFPKDVSVPSLECPDDPIGNLMREHGEEMDCLHCMENAVQSIEVNGFSVEAFQTVADTVRIIGKQIFNHSEKEERYLFPLVENHVDGPTELMRSEHRKLWQVYNDLMEVIQDVEDGRLHGFSVSALVQKTKFLVEYLSIHIKKENTVLFKMARRLLTTEEYRKLQTNLLQPTR